MNDTGTDIRKLYGVGEVKAAAYARMGIHTVGDLLSHYPRGYEDRGNVILLSQADGQSKSAHLLTVATEPKCVRLKARMSLLKFRAYDDSGICDITFFNQDYLKSSFPPGGTFRFYGKVEKNGKNFSMSSPAFEVWSEETQLPPLVSVYPLTEGISQKQIAKDVKSALIIAAYAATEEDLLPEQIRHKYSLCTRSYALRNIHMPESFSALAAAKKRLIFDEFFLFALGIALAGNKGEKVPAVPCRENDLSSFLNLLPYRLTDDQRHVIDEIAGDMKQDTAMSRMVVGDVGCGKTVCAAAAMLIAVQSGRQAALMAPTEILARQHYTELCGWFEALGIRCALLIGAMTASQKRKVHEGLCSGDPEKRIQVVIGTQALLSEGVEFFAPGLVVTDEQHRFGVNQRAELARKSALTHTLVMSATPIPRSLALTLYGDLDLSAIRQMPPGRQRVDTFAVDESYRERLNGFIRKQTDDGGQVYVVCPAVEVSEEEEADVSLEDVDEDGNVRRGKKKTLKAVTGFSEQLQERFPDLTVALIHGKLKSAEKDDIMRRFAGGEIQILVSTTVIEVGVNVPNASLMIVENAEQFGLSQLHQLRGRVGRGKRKSYCVLVSDAASGEGVAHDRLMTMRTLYDGYAIAEKDLAMRGPGDFLRGSGEATVRQSGGIRFRLAELCNDNALFMSAMEEARRLLAQSPDLESYPALKNAVYDLFTPDKGTVN